MEENASETIMENGESGESGGLRVTTVTEEASHDRGRKKIKADCAAMEEDKEPTMSAGASYKDTLIDAEMKGCSKDTRGSGVFDEAWQEHIASLKAFFGETDANDDEQVVNDGGRCIPNLVFSQEQYERWCAPWRNSLIVKVLGRNLSLWSLQSKLQRIWRTKETYTVRDIDNGYFVVSFNCEEDLNYVYFEGPWLVADHYLLIQRWRPNFDPWLAGQQKRIAAWVRVPLLPLEFFNAESLSMIGNLIGKTLKVDSVTYLKERGRFARICVELDLAKSLTPAIRIFGKARSIEYEGLHLICFHCGRYGHHQELCPDRQNVATHDAQDTKGGSEEGKARDTRDNLEDRTDSGTSSRESVSVMKRSRHDGVDGGSVDNPPQPGESMGVWNLVKRNPRKPKVLPERLGTGNANLGKFGLSTQGSRTTRDPRHNGRLAVIEEGLEAKFDPGLPEASRKFGREIGNNKRWVKVDQIPRKQRLTASRKNMDQRSGPNNSMESGPRNGAEQGSAFMLSKNPFMALNSMHEDATKENMDPNCGQTDGEEMDLKGASEALTQAQTGEFPQPVPIGPQGQNPPFQVSQ